MFSNRLRMVCEALRVAVQVIWILSLHHIHIRHLQK